MASYRLIDEFPNAKKRRPPWSPVGLFVVTVLSLPLGAPLWVLNWGRLGRPEKRLPTLLLAVVAFGFPLGMAMAKTNLEAARTVASIAKLVFAYFQLGAQRPLFDAHLQRGGAKASALALWIAAAAGIAIQIALALR